jgi:hypothetical protein
MDRCPGCVIRRGNFHQAELCFGLRRIAARYAVGNHAYSHPHLPRLSDAGSCPGEAGGRFEGGRLAGGFANVAAAVRRE